MADGLPDMEATFNVEGDGVNADQLDALDRTEWRLRPLSADEQRALDAEEPFEGSRTEVLEFEGLIEEHLAPMWVCDACSEAVCDGADIAVTVAAMQALRERAQGANPPWV